MIAPVSSTDPCPAMPDNLSNSLRQTNIMSKSSNHTLIIAADTGGTFTDFIWYENETLLIHKRPSTPTDPAKAVIEGIASIARNMETRLLLGTTVATNTMIERSGATTAIITNRGFEDIIEIGRQNRVELYDLFSAKTDPLVEPQNRFGISGRINSKGDIIEPIDIDEIRNIGEKINNREIESVAVCLLFSFLNPDHEKTVERYLKSQGVNISLSCEILPEFREYERLSVTTANAYVAPRTSEYIGRIKKARSISSISVMQSNGGHISAAEACRIPVRTLLSGPAGGVVAAVELARKIGISKIITLDMGGTSTDVSLADGKIPLTTETEVAGIPINLPMIDIHTVGAGGGSIARIDSSEALAVGPQSAGADPGPACYGKGDHLTVTDANLYCGRIFAGAFLGGNLNVYEDRTRRFMKRMAGQLGISCDHLAEGIISVAEAVMERAIRKISVERGFDPSSFSLVVFGGAGGLHGNSLARALRIPRVIIPLHPGIFSAYGILCADVVKDTSKTVMLDVSARNFFSKIEAESGRMAEKLRIALLSEGISQDMILIDKSVDIRYKGQTYTLNIPMGPDLLSKFHAAHKLRFGYCFTSGQVEIVNLRVRATGKKHNPEIQPCVPGVQNPDNSALICTKPVLFSGKWIQTSIWDRGKLKPGNKIAGPAVITEYSATTLVLPGTSAQIDGFGNIIITLY